MLYPAIAILLLPACQPKRPAEAEHRPSAPAFEARSIEAPADRDAVREVSSDALPFGPVTSTVRCFDAPNAYILAASARSASAWSRTMCAASSAFRAHFGTYPPRGLLLELGVDRPDAESLERAGIAWTLYWLDPPGDWNQESLEQSAGALAHELGHAWFRALLYPDLAPTGGAGHARYGTEADDWLDEAAALLTEPTSMSDARWLQLSKLVAAEDMIPLEQLLSMQHPGSNQADFRAAVERARREGRVEERGRHGQVVVREIAPGAASPAFERVLRYYAGCWSFSRYLMETTGDERAVFAIALARRAGVSFDTWLKQTGSRFGLPDTLPTLEQSYRSWCREKLAARR